MDHQRTIVIGISGVSSSGKTTLARLLRDLFPETFILHEDDFYKPESECVSFLSPRTLDSQSATLLTPRKTPHHLWTRRLGLPRGHLHPRHA